MISYKELTDLVVPKDYQDLSFIRDLTSKSLRNKSKHNKAAELRFKARLKKRRKK